MPQDRKPLPKQTAHKAWAAAFGALAANVVIWLLAYVDVVTTAETYGLLVTLFTPAGAGLAAYAKRNWVKVIGGVPCHPLAVALAATLLLAGCAEWTLDGRIDEREARSLDSARQVALSQVIAWNAAGVDPVQLPPEDLAMARLGCGSIVALGALVQSDNPELPEQLAGWCATLHRAAGPASAAPQSAPAPAPRPGS